MSSIADVLRRFWLPGLNEVTGKLSLADIRTWISEHKFQVYHPVAYPFKLDYADLEPVCEAFAGEILRMSMASLESIASIQPIIPLPKSKAWAVIQLYYAAFYSAHALLRMGGKSLTQLEAGHMREIQRIANLYGQTYSASAGFHLVDVNTANKQLTFHKMNGDGGSHEFMWEAFEEWLRICSQGLLATPGGSLDLQEISNKLDALRSVLNSPPAKRGAWLSYVRNRVNYRHELAAWFPYAGHDDNDLRMFAILTTSPIDAGSISILNPASHVRPLECFVAACRFIIALCMDMASEMAARCPTGTSFQSRGILQLERLLRQPRA